MTSSAHSSSTTSHSSNTESHLSNGSFQALQLVVEEKNKVIEMLQKRLHNQKIQLEFYIKKELQYVTEFAKTCVPEAAEENLMVSLALNKFCREIGVKSRIMRLYDRIWSIPDRASSVVETLEDLLKGTVGKLCNSMTPQDLENLLGSVDVNINYVELFNSLVSTTLLLRKDLRDFRTWCERLVQVEDKRNTIVEQVYSLTSEERLVCNYLVGIQLEKLELERLITKVSKNRKVSSAKNGNEIATIEKNLKFLHERFDWMHPGQEFEESCVAGMLENVYAQAMSLLTLSKDQKDKFTTEIDHLRQENDKLRQTIQHVEMRRKQEKVVATDYHDIEKLHNVIKRTIIQARKFEITKTEELERKSEECEKLKQKLSEMVQK